MKARMIRHVILTSALSLGMAATLQAAPQNLDQNLDDHSLNRLAVNQSVVLGLSETRQALRAHRLDWLQTSRDEQMTQGLAQQDGWIPAPGEGSRVAENPVEALVDASEPMAARLPSGLVIYIGNR